jgi:hypothetical protein
MPQKPRIIDLIFLSVLLTGSAIGILHGFPVSQAASAPIDTFTSAIKGTDQKVKAHAREEYGKLPLSFIANDGQIDSRVKFISRGDGYSLFLTSSEAILALSKPQAGKKGATKDNTPSHHVMADQSCALSMKLIGAQTDPRLEGLDELPGKVNYLVGNDAGKWRTNIPTYSKVKYQGIYQGVDLVYYGNQQQLEYDFIVSPGADPGAIKIAFQGMQRLVLNKQGDLILRTKDGDVSLHKPIVYQEVNGQRLEVASRYVIKSHHQVGFEVGNYDKNRLLIIDPVLVYSTYLGGSNGDPTMDETANSVAVDAAGNTYVTGTTTSSDFPVVKAYQATGVDDAFISKLNSTGTALLYSTYLGGNRRDYGNGIAIDSQGSAYVTGTTESRDFPVTPGAYQTNGLDEDVFVTKLNVAGNGLVYSTLLSGDRHPDGQGFTLASSEHGRAIAVNAQGEAYVVGETQSANFPSANPVQASLSALYDLFVTKLNANGTGLVFSTYLGGKDTDYCEGIALDSLGNAYVTGTISSKDFPTTSGAFKSTNGVDGTDAIVAKFSANGALVYSTYVGGDSYDSAHGIAVDGNGNAFITGDTISNNFPFTATALKKRSSKGAVFKSTDGSGKWKTTGLTDQFAINAVAIDPINPATIYAGSDGGIFKSNDGGSSWTTTGLANVIVRSIAIDPGNQSKIFAGTFGQGIFKSTDGGNTWTNPVATGNVSALVFDPRGSDKVYAGTNSGVLISTDGGDSWATFRAGSNIKAIVFDPTNPSIIYLCSTNGIIKSVDGGANWNFVLQQSSFASLVIDPKNPSILYAANQSFGVYKTTDAGLNWATVNNGLASNQVNSLAIDPVNSSIIYAGSIDNGVYKTTNGGSNWAVTGLAYSSVNALTIDPTNPSVLYAGSFTSQTDAFVTELNAAGSALVYSSYLGGTGYDKAFGIAVDSQGNPYITGTTASIDFPLAQLLQQMSGIATEAFIMKLNGANKSLVFSTYLGGSKPDQANGITVDADGNIYVVGVTHSGNFPTTSALQPTLNNISDAFITKISAPGPPSTPSTLQLSASSYSVGEASGHVDITVNRTGGSVGAVTVNYATSDGTATAGSDYSSTSGTLSFADGETTKSFTVPITNDSLNEANETVNLSLSSVNGNATLGTPSTAVLTIIDDDPQPEITINDISILEGNSGQTTAVFTVSLSTKTTGQVTVQYRTSAGTATSDEDYMTAFGTILFGPQQSSQTIFVPINGETLYEPDETFFVNLSNPTNAVIVKVQGVCTILNDDIPNMQLSKSSYTVNEGAGSASVVVVRGDISNAASVNYATSDPAGLTNCNVINGIASSRCDYVTSVGTLRFAVGESSKTISIPIVDDNFTEGNETFAITLSNPSAGTTFGSNTTATVTIADNANTSGNPIDNVTFFVRQHYIDFLGREPDSFGQGWRDMLNTCTSGDISCDRIEVSSRFFRSAEFQERGYFVYRFYSASFGRKPNYEEFIPDVAKVSGFLTEAEKEANKVAFVDEFMQRTEFRNKYDSQTTPTAYVNALIASSGLSSHPSHDGWIAGLTNGSLTRAQVLRQLAESAELSNKYSVEAFVVMQYFGYLRRNPDSQYKVWIATLNQNPADYRRMVDGFMNSTEYKARFGQ